MSVTTTLIPFADKHSHRFDRIAELKEISVPSFVDSYQNEVKAIQTGLYKYMQAIITKQTQPEVPFGIAQVKYKLKFSDAGFPKLDVPLPSQGWKKKQWEDLFSEYMGHHYSEYLVLLFQAGV